MWNNYWGGASGSGRPSRNLPKKNYKEESSESDDSPLTSPSRPPVSRAGSPPELAIPQLNDNVDEELIQVRNTLRNIGHTPLFRSEDIKKEEVVEGIIVGQPVGVSVANMPDNPRYDQATGDDDGDVYKKLSTLKTPFNKSDAKFWFANFERSIKHFGVKSQITKKEALIKQLTQEAIDECKNLIALEEDEAGDTPYFDLKTELLSLFGPRPEDSYAKAASRVLVGKPSALAKQIINDVCECPKPLQSKCCAKICYGMWIKNLPTYLRAHISGMPFNINTYKDVMTKADECWLSHKQETPTVAAIKAENAAALADSNDLENPAVAAIKAARGGANARGRGQRGGRGGQGGRGARGGRGGRGGRQLGPRHPQAVEGSCYVHHQYGPEAWSCADRHNCPMRDIFIPR